MKQLTRDLEHDLFEKLAEGPRHITELVLLLRCRKEKLNKIINKHENVQLHVKKIGTRKVISLIPHNFEQEHYMLTESMKSSKYFLNKVFLPKLKKKKPIFKNLVQFDNGIQYWVNPKAREDLDNISLQMDHIMQLSFNLTYNDALGLIPKKFYSQYKEDQKLCIETMEYYLIQLKKLAGKKYEDAIKNYFFHKKRLFYKLKL